jgi:hypothetical protein
MLDDIKQQMGEIINYIEDDSIEPKKISAPSCICNAITIKKTDIMKAPIIVKDKPKVRRLTEI